jgi:hypothetical protein
MSSSLPKAEDCFPVLILGMTRSLLKASVYPMKSNNRTNF